MSAIVVGFEGPTEDSVGQWRVCNLLRCCVYPLLCSSLRYEVAIIMLRGCLVVKSISS